MNYWVAHRPQELQQELWNLLNDSGRTTLCVRYKAEVVACGLIFLAARRCKVRLSFFCFCVCSGAVCR